MTQKPLRSTRRHRWLNIVLATVLTLLMLALVAIYLAGRPPSFYVPAPSRDRERLLDGAIAFSKHIQEFVNLVWGEPAHPVEVTDDEVNGYIAAANDPGIWNDPNVLRFAVWRKTLASDWLRNVQVQFTEGCVTVAGEITWRGMDLVLSVSGHVECDDKGQARLRVTGIRAGSLPLPKSLFGDFLKSIDDRPVPGQISNWRLKAVEVHDGKAVLIGETVTEKK